MDGKPFRIVKFRTMEIDADAKLFALLREQEADGTPLFKVQDDPRITRLGGFLRKYSIDELPQLFNVLAGTMSLVGPRPQRQEEVDLYTGNADHRLGVRPGMTGLWQVSGRSNLGWEQGQALDIAYAYNASLLLDARILIRTVSVVPRPPTRPCASCTGAVSSPPSAWTSRSNWCRSCGGSGPGAPNCS